MGRKGEDNENKDRWKGVIEAATYMDCKSWERKGIILLLFVIINILNFIRTLDVISNKYYNSIQ